MVICSIKKVVCSMNKVQYIKNFPLLGIIITKTFTEQSYKLI